MPIHDWTRVEAGIFHHFHLQWIATLCKALNHGGLPEGYYALAEGIVKGFEPDVLALQARGPEPSSNAPGSAGVAVVSAPPKVRYAARYEVTQYARRQRRLAIRHVSDDRLVAIIEIVSPGNKSSVRALQSFATKAAEFLDAGIHLLILDLFPPGPRDPQGIHGTMVATCLGEDDFSLPAGQQLTLAAYLAGLVTEAFVEPVAVGDMLPDMPLFITVDSYVPVPLEATYQAAFEEVPKRWRDELMDG